MGTNSTNKKKKRKQHADPPSPSSDASTPKRANTSPTAQRGSSTKDSSNSDSRASATRRQPSKPSATRPPPPNDVITDIDLAPTAHSTSTSTDGTRTTDNGQTDPRASQKFDDEESETESETEWDGNLHPTNPTAQADAKPAPAHNKGKADAQPAKTKPRSPIVPPKPRRLHDGYDPDVVVANVADTGRVRFMPTTFKSPLGPSTLTATSPARTSTDPKSPATTPNRDDYRRMFLLNQSLQDEIKHLKASHASQSKGIPVRDLSAATSAFRVQLDVVIKSESQPDARLQLLLRLRHELSSRCTDGAIWSGILLVNDSANGSSFQVLDEPYRLSLTDAIQVAQQRINSETRALNRTHAEASMDPRSVIFASQTLCSVLEQSMDADTKQKFLSSLLNHNEAGRDGLVALIWVFHFIFPSAMLYRAQVNKSVHNLCLQNGDYSAFIEKVQSLKPLVLDESELTLQLLTTMTAHPVPLVRGPFETALQQASQGEATSSLTELLLKATHNLTSFGSAAPAPAASATVDHSDNPAAQLLSMAAKTNNPQLLTLAAQAVGDFTNDRRNRNRRDRDRDRRDRRPKPKWLHEAPSDPKETREFHDRTWGWCPACKIWSTNIANAHKDPKTCLARAAKRQANSSSRRSHFRGHFNTDTMTVEQRLDLCKSIMEGNK